MKDHHLGGPGGQGKGVQGGPLHVQVHGGPRSIDKFVICAVKI